MLIKNSKFVLHSLYFLFNLLGSSHKQKCLWKIESIGVKYLNAYADIFQGLRNEAIRDCKSGQILGTTNQGKRDLRWGQFKGFQIGEKRLQIRAKRFQVGPEITNPGKKDYEPGQGFQIGAGITNRCRINAAYGKAMENFKNRIDVRLGNNRKNHLKWSWKPNFVS